MPDERRALVNSGKIEEEYAQILVDYLTGLRRLARIQSNGLLCQVVVPLVPSVRNTHILAVIRPDSLYVYDVCGVQAIEDGGPDHQVWSIGKATDARRAAVLINDEIDRLLAEGGA